MTGRPPYGSLLSHPHITYRPAAPLQPPCRLMHDELGEQALGETHDAGHGLALVFGTYPLQFLLYSFLFFVSCNTRYVPLTGSGDLLIFLPFARQSSGELPCRTYVSQVDCQITALGCYEILFPLPLYGDLYVNPAVFLSLA